MKKELKREAIVLSLERIDPGSLRFYQIISVGVVSVLSVILGTIYGTLLF